MPTSPQPLFSRRRLLRTGAAAGAAAGLAIGLGRVLSRGGAASPSDPAAAGAQPVDFAELERVIGEAMARAKVPGVAVGIIHGEREYAAGFGITSVDRPRPVDADTLFQIGSITKTVTGTVLMRLIEDGRLQLDEPVRTWLADSRLPDPEITAGLTLRHIVTHTGGWYGDLGLFDFRFGSGDDALDRFVTTLERAPLLAPLGAIFSYNNSAFALAGRLIEVVTGMTFEAATTALVFDPLDLRRTFFLLEQVMAEPFAHGHGVRGDRAVVVRPWPIPRNYNAAGGISTSVRELLRYARFHLGAGAPLLGPDALRLMQTPLFRVGPPGPEEGAVGVAWSLGETPDGSPVVSHGGGTNGQVALLILRPAQAYALVVLTNSGESGPVIGAVVDWARQNLFGEPPPDPPPDAVPVPVERLQEYVGVFHVPGVREVALALEGETLTARAVSGFPPGTGAAAVPVEFVGADRARVLGRGAFDRLPVEFLRDRSGRVMWLRSGGRAMVRKE